jgi:hypothetical protein
MSAVAVIRAWQFEILLEELGKENAKRTGYIARGAVSKIPIIPL